MTAPDPQPATYQIEEMVQVCQPGPHYGQVATIVSAFQSRYLVEFSGWSQRGYESYEAADLRPAAAPLPPPPPPLDLFLEWSPHSPQEQVLLQLLGGALEQLAALTDPATAEPFAHTRPATLGPVGQAVVDRLTAGMGLDPTLAQQYTAAWPLGSSVTTRVVPAGPRTIPVPVDSRGIVYKHEQGLIWVAFARPLVDSAGETWPRRPDQRWVKLGYEPRELELVTGPPMPPARLAAILHQD